MAEDVVDGICCANCMTLFTKAHGYPVICRSCAPSFSKAELKETGYQIATEREA
jgi:hypothetical protein